MKRILTFLFLLSSVFGVIAANPALTDFLGTNQVNIITNPTTKKVLIGPDTPISTTASNAANALNLWTNSNGTLSNKVSSPVAILSKAGGSTSNVVVGGTVFVNATPIASAGTSATNLMTWTIPAHLLTNNLDRIRVTLWGNVSAALDVKTISLIYGSQTLLGDFGLGGATTGWQVTADIVRTGNTSETCNARWETEVDTVNETSKIRHVAGVQTNGIATPITLRGTAASNGGITNTMMIVEWHPAPR